MNLLKSKKTLPESPFRLSIISHVWDCFIPTSKPLTGKRNGTDTHWALGAAFSPEAVSCLRANLGWGSVNQGRGEGMADQWVTKASATNDDRDLCTSLSFKYARAKPNTAVKQVSNLSNLERFCVGFLLLLQEITVYLVLKNNTNLLSSSSGSQKPETNSLPNQSFGTMDSFWTLAESSWSFPTVISLVLLFCSLSYWGPLWLHWAHSDDPE